MLWVLCTLISGACFFFSVGLGEVWLLAWAAPVPVLAMALSRPGAAPAFAAAFSAYALGGLNLLPAYWGVLPLPVLMLAILAPAALFALAALGGHFAAHRLSPAAGALAFAALWAGFDFLLAFDPAGGSVLTPAASQVAAPALIQTASAAGFCAVTFLLGLVSGCASLSAGRKDVRMGALALVLFASNYGFGLWRMSDPPAARMRVALIASDTAIGEIWSADEPSARNVLRAYASEVRALAGRDVDLVVLPENLMRIDPAWRDEALAPVRQLADDLGVSLVAGFNTELDGVLYNVAWATRPGGEPAYYAKRRLVPGLETPIYARGKSSLALPDGVMVAICKDLDFAEMISADTFALHPRLIAVPAWDFRRDGWAHARIAILRGVENGAAVARTARDGRLTLTDRYGRLAAHTVSGDGFSVVVADVPLAPAPGPTLYTRTGSLFSWLFLSLGILLTVSALFRRRPDPS